MTPKQQNQEQLLKKAEKETFTFSSAKKVGPLRSQLVAEEKRDLLEKPRHALVLQQSSPRVKGETVEGNVAKIYDKRLEQVLDR